MRSRSFVLLVAATMLLGGAAHSEPITFAFTGHVIATNKADVFPLGQTISGRYTFESTTPDASPGNPEQGIYTGAVSAFSFTSGSYAVVANAGNSANHGGQINVNRNSVFEEHQYQVFFMRSTAQVPLWGPNVDSEQLISMWLRLIDADLSAITSTDLPLTPPDLGDFTSNTFGLVFESDPTGEPGVVFELETLVLGPTHLPPDCSHAVASEPTLWPPNHKYHPISILGVTDAEGDPVTITVTGITQDESVGAEGSGNTCPDATIVEGVASVRAERSGKGNGRTYEIRFIAEDDNGGLDSGTVRVCVPHDRHHDVCTDDGQLYSSTDVCEDDDDVLAEDALDLAVNAVSASQAEISFFVPETIHVEVAIFDITGRRVTTIESAELSSGAYDRVWNMDGVARGLYFVRLHAGEATLSRRVLKLP